MNTSTVLWYDHPAQRWTQALPLGNGALGAMVHGRWDHELIALNLDTLWSGRPYEDQNIPGAYEAYCRARELSAKGEDAQAQQVLEKGMLSARNGQTYLPLGDLRIDFDARGRAANYARRLDLETAVHTARWDWTVGGTTAPVEMESFVSAPAGCLAVRVVSGAEHRMNISLDSQLRHACFVQDGLLIMDGQCPGSTNLLRDGFLDEDGMFVRTVCGVRTDGRLRAQGAVLLVEDARETVIILAAEDSFNGFDRDPVSDGKEYRRPPVERVRAALETKYDRLRAVHIGDYADLFSRVRLSLGETGCASKPTDQRLKAHDQGAWDPSLYALLFNYGRYLGIAASRPGTEAMNLQGVWNDQLFAPWAGNYTVNINTEMNYWPMLAGNLAELDEPLIRMIRELAVTGREAAQSLYHAPGWVCHHNSDLWRQAFPAFGLAQWGFWYNGGAWLARHLYDHYLYTMDEAFLRGTAYPLIRGCAEFYLSQLTEDEEGWLILSPSTSPENNHLLPDGAQCSVARTTAMTMSIARETLENAADCARRLNADEDFRREIERVLPRLLPLRIGGDGRLMEWYRDAPDAEPHHRHVSHLYALHPAHQISPERTPELAEACWKTLEARGDDGTGWSLGWKINFWARLRDGDRALKLLDRQLQYVPDEPISDEQLRHISEETLRGGGTYPNLFDAHPPFQIDGNFGAVSGILEMLLQQDGDCLALLPALPKKWADGSVTGLKAPGNITVDMAWKDGCLTRAAFAAASDSCLTVCADGEKQVVQIRNGKGEWFPQAR